MTGRLLRAYVGAWERGDVHALLAILRSDAMLEMPPVPSAVAGRAAIRAFLSQSILDGTPGRWRGVTTEANGGPAVALYQREGAGFTFTGVQLIGVRDGKVASLIAYMDPQLAARFRLPARLPARES